MLLALGLGVFSIITPLLQVTLATIYFKKFHIWHNVLNAHLEDEVSCKDWCFPEWFTITKQLLKTRFMY